MQAYGQVFMVGLPGPRVEAVARELVRDLGVGGVILFARNLEDPLQVWELTSELQRLARERGGPPLLLAVDQEGGPVQRLKGPFTRIPSARELGEKAEPREVEALYHQVARELALVGVNLNLAPVVDVARSPDCPLWERSFGPDPEKVAAYGMAAIRGLRAGGVLAAAKHFPGLGDTRRDSHLVLPTAEGADPERAVDLKPFAAAVAVGVPLIMTAHLRVPAWEEAPATLSPVAIRTWLRGRLGFGGVVMTDDLEMGAIREQGEVASAALQALAAGADLLLICEHSELAWEAARRLEKTPALKERLAEASARLARLRARLPASCARREVEAYFAPILMRNP
ncbi:MAG: beta-N-acetylhexosaminidase [Syntrophobacterales bacterium]|nr:beta-N-acetylhexosaminidase [Syntrophobacterales bacterium]